MKTIRLCFARTLAVCFLGISGVMSCLAPPAQADTVYTYTGNPFDVFFGVTCPPLCSLSGYIVVAAPIDFQDFRFEPVLAYSFTDGITTLTASNSTIFGGIGVSGDGLGNISRWVIEVQGTSSPVEMEPLFSPTGVPQTVRHTFPSRLMSRGIREPGRRPR